MGTPVFGGRIAVAVLGIFMIAPLYVIFQAIRARLRPGARPKVPPPGGPAAEPAAPGAHS